MEGRAPLCGSFPLPRQLCARVADDATGGSGPPAVPARDTARRSSTEWHVTASASAHCPEHVRDHERAGARRHRCARDTARLPLHHCCLWRRRAPQRRAWLSRSRFVGRRSEALRQARYPIRHVSAGAVSAFRRARCLRWPMDCTAKWSSYTKTVFLSASLRTSFELHLRSSESCPISFKSLNTSRYYYFYYPNESTTPSSGKNAIKQKGISEGLENLLIS